MIKIVLGWELVPGRDAAWYEDKKARTTPDELAREQDRKYIFSISGRVFMPFVNRLHLTENEIPVNRDLPIYRIWDFGKTNAVIYGQIDTMGRRRFLRERVLEKSDTTQQISVAKNDCERWFPNHRDFVDICDPAGNYDDGRGLSTHVEMMQSAGIHPTFDRIVEMPTVERKKRARERVNADLQHMPGGDSAFLLYANGDDGCPILLEAMNSAYCYKKDKTGNYTDTIEENHPYEDVIDCMLYWYLQASPNDASREPFKMITPNRNVNPYTGY